MRSTLSEQQVQPNKKRRRENKSIELEEQQKPQGGLGKKDAAGKILRPNSYERDDTIVNLPKRELPAFLKKETDKS